MNTGKRIQSSRSQDLDKELTDVLLAISDTAERMARNILILREKRKSKGVKHYVTKRVRKDCD